MALLKCPECEHEVSSHAKTCPSCGCPIAKRKGLSPFLSTGLAVFITGLIASVYSVPKFYSTKADLEALFKKGGDMSVRYSDLGRMLESFRLIAAVSLIILLLGVAMLAVGLASSKRKHNED